MENVRFIVALSVAGLLSFRGLKRRTLSKSGAIAAFIIGFSTFSAGYAFGVVLIGFYYSGTQWTKLNAPVKIALDANYRVGGQRNAKQVLAASLTATLLVITHTMRDRTGDHIQKFLVHAFLGHYACCSADTWASEIGILSKSGPVLITTLSKVPRGTNGAISFLGIGASIVGGGCMGLIYYIASNLLEPTKYSESDIGVYVIPFTMFLGLFGSILDSLLGALVQETLYDKEKRQISDVSSVKSTNLQHISGRHLLSNEGVNAVSTLITAILGGAIGALL